MAEPATEVRTPYGTATVDINIYDQTGKEVEHLVKEEELGMSDPQQADYLKYYVGDGNARVTVSVSRSEKNFGSGGDVHVSISLTCDQSGAVVENAAAYAYGLASNYVERFHTVMRDRMIQLGLIK